MCLHPLKDTLKSQSLVPQDVTLFENGVISDVLSQGKMRSHWRRVDPGIQHDGYLYVKREIWTQTPREDNRVKLEAVNLE